MQPVGPVTISIGVAVFPDHGRDVDELIDVADRAMYASKEMGRNRVTLSGAEPEAAALEAAAA
jgi:diguanylate cyclase (GGDEF)-like protein